MNSEPLNETRAERIVQYLHGELQAKKRAMARAKRKYKQTPTKETLLELDIAQHLYISLSAVVRVCKSTIE